MPLILAAVVAGMLAIWPTMVGPYLSARSCVWGLDGHKTLEDCTNAKLKEWPGQIIHIGGDDA